MKKLLSLLLILFSYVIAYSQWKQTNGPTGGYVNSIAFEEEKIFAGTTGVFLSSNMGNKWRAINNGFPLYLVTSIIIKENMIIAGTAGEGIYLSTNYGDSWSKADTGIKDKYIRVIAKYGSNLLAGTYVDLYLSTDNGGNWKLISLQSSGYYAYGPNCLAIKGNNIFAGVNGYFDNNKWDGAGILLTTNDGANWKEVNNGLNNWRVKALLITEDDRIFAGTEDGLYLTTNDGEIWSKADSGISSLIILSLAEKENTIYAGTVNGIFVSTNKGVSWSNLNPNFNTTQIYCFGFNDSNIFIGTDRGIFLSTNKGESWTAKNAGLANGSVFEFVTKDNNIYAGGYKDGFFVSTDFGDSWNSMNNGLTNKNIYQLAIDDSTIYAGMWLSGGIYVSTNLGESWAKAISGMNNTRVNDIAVIDNKSFAATDVGMYVSTDKGAYWSEVDTNLSNWKFGGFAINGNNFIATSNYGIYLSTDSGEKWIYVDSNMVDYSRIICIEAGYDNIYAGTIQNGLFISTNNGRTWSAINNGLPIKIISALSIIGNNVFVYVNGEGLYLSTNSGESWRKAEDGFTGNVNGFLILEEYIYAGTGGYGVFKAKLSDFGISDVDEKPVVNSDGFDIYPIPADDFISINFQDMALKPEYIRLYDMYGNLVYENGNVSENNLKIRTKEIASGMYVLQVGNMITRKIIVVH